MSKAIQFLCILAAVLLGVQLGLKPQKKQIATIEKDFDSELSLKERKTFALVVYAYNQSDWVERSLRSIFEQEYDYYRIVFIDDGSKDGTFELAEKFVQENNQLARTIFIRNEEKLGAAQCFHQAIGNLLDQEIAIPLFAKDWFAHSGVLTRMNLAFQNPDVWTASSQGLAFPSYERVSDGIQSFYAALFKQIPLKTLKESESRRKDSKFYPFPMEDLAKGRTKHVDDVLFFRNDTFKYGV